MKTTLLLMTLNEIDGMKAIMPRIERNWVDQILVADSGSTDGTIEWAKMQGFDLHICPKRGLTKSYLSAWPHISGDIVIYFSPDGNSVPEAIPLLIEKMGEGYDMVTASRYLDGAKSYDDDWLTAFGNWFFRTLINLFLKPRGDKRMTDPLVMLRAHKKDLPHQLGIDRPEPLDAIFKTNSCWIPLLSMRSLKHKIRWTEIPADEPSRIGGKRKLEIFKFGHYIWCKY